MGTCPSVSHDKSPRQGAFLHARVKVCFNYDTANVVSGTVVRDDVEAPGETIIALDDGRYVLSTECQYRKISADGCPEGAPPSSASRVMAEAILKHWQKSRFNQGYFEGADCLFCLCSVHRGYEAAPPETHAHKPGCVVPVAVKAALGDESR